MSSIRSPPRWDTAKSGVRRRFRRGKARKTAAICCGRPAGASLRVWPVGSDVDLDTPSKRGAASRVSPLRRASRVLRTCGESAGLVTNGEALRLIYCDPAGPDSQIVISLSGRAGWVSRPDVPESYRLIFALASPSGVAAAGEIFDAARMHQTAVTKTLRSQARAAIEDFLQCVIDRSCNAGSIPAPEILWRQALTIVYRLLFILKLESSAEPRRRIQLRRDPRHGVAIFLQIGRLVHWSAAISISDMIPAACWRMACGSCFGSVVKASCIPRLSIAPLGGGLFDPSATEALDRLHWGERAVALLLDHLLWTVPRGKERERVHYGSLDVEELGRVYESLLDLEPDIATSPMIRTRRGRLEAVMPATAVRWLQRDRPRAHSNGPLLSAYWPWAPNRWLLLHAAWICPVFGARDPGTAGHSVDRGRQSRGHPADKGARSRHGERTFSGRGVPFPCRRSL